MVEKLRYSQKRVRDLKRESSLFHPLYLQFHPVNRIIKNYFQKIRKNKIVCDFGCGDKPYQIYCPKNTKYIGIDIDKANVNADIFSSVYNVPLPQNYADYVVSFFVLEHTEEPQKMLKEMYRVLKPKGKLFMIVPLFWVEHEEPFDFYRFTRYGILYLLRRTHFKKIKINPINSFFSYLGIFLNQKIYKFKILRFIIPFSNLFFKCLEKIYFNKNKKAITTFSVEAEK